MTAPKKVHEEDKQEQQKQSFMKPLFGLVFLGGIAAGGFYLWQHPEIVRQLKSKFLVSEAVEDVYQPQIDELKQQLSDMRRDLGNVSYKADNPDLTEFSRRIDDIQAISVNTIKSKADVETVLGLIGRMDQAEGRLNDLSKVTNDGALLLTAAMLVKDAGQRGGTFVYEAEVLDELAAGHHKIAKEVARISEIAAIGVPTVSELQREFAVVYLQRYPEAPKEEEVVANNWKDRIYHQLRKFVKIKKTDQTSKQEEPVFSEEDRAWSIIRDFVLEGDIEKAVGIIQKPLNEKVASDEELEKWLEHARIYCDFYSSVSRISANALAVMKVKFLKNL